MRFASLMQLAGTLDEIDLVQDHPADQSLISILVIFLYFSLIGSIPSALQFERLEFRD